MLERPDVADAALIEHLRDGWGLEGAELRFMPVGLDASAWAYEVRIATDERYFLKVRRGATDLAAVIVARHLHQRGLSQVVAAMDSLDGGCWHRADDLQLLLYPFIEAREAADGFTDAQWRAHGAFMGALHGMELTPDVASLVAEERFDCPESSGVRDLAEHVRRGRFSDPVQRELAQFWRERDALITALVDRVDQLAIHARDQRLPHVLCHADIHAGNILVGHTDQLFVVDWDAPIVAPAERDLLFVVGASVHGLPVTEAQEALFWQGYGAFELNWSALAYYRYQRVVEDIDAFGREVLLRDDLGPQTKAESLAWFRHQFAPGNAVDRALGTERHLG